MTAACRHRSFDKTVDRSVQRFNRFHVILLDCLDYAMTDVVLHDQLACVIDRVPDCGQLDQYIAAVFVPLHHPFNSLQMADCPGQAVDHGFFFLLTVDMVVSAMRMAVGMAVLIVRMAMGMAVLIVRMAMGMAVLIVFMAVRMTMLIVRMVMGMAVLFVRMVMGMAVLFVCVAAGMVGSRDVILVCH
jgi:hypothetical protein